MNLTLKAQDYEAQDSIKIYKVPSITVTTTRAETGRTPVTFSEISSTEINQTYTVQDIPKFLSSMPSIIYYSENGNGIGYSNLTMRGFNQRRISVFINGIPQNDPEDHNVYWIDFPDLTSSLDNIQVQRGAGMINYGAAAIGGSINLTTSNFINKKGVFIQSGFGWQEYGTNDGNSFLQLNLNKQSIEVASGLIDNYAIYARLSRINSEGYRDRAFAYLNSYFLGAALFTDNLTTQINIFGGPINDGLAYTGLPKSYIKDRSLRRKNPSWGGWGYNESGDSVSYFSERKPQEVEEFSQPHFEILNDWQISDMLSLKSSLFYYQGEGYFDYDGSWADTNYFRLTSEYGFNPTSNPGNSIIRSWVGNKQYGWIPRMILNHSNGEFTLGAEIRFHNSEHWGKIKIAESLPAGFDPDYKFYSYDGVRSALSLFARERFYLTDDLLLTAEFQIVRQHYSIKNDKQGNKFSQFLNTEGKIVGNGDPLFDINYYFFNPRLGFNYHFSDNLSFYGLTAFTSREPRMKNLYPVDDQRAPLFEGDTIQGGIVRYDFTKPLVKPEQLLNFELGLNYNTEKFYGNLTFYWMEFFNELVKSGRVDIFGNPIDGNADRTRHYGIELEFGYLLFEGKYGSLNIGGNLTLSSNRIIKYDFITDNLDKIDLKNNPIAGFPDAMGLLRLNYSLNNFNLMLLGKYVGEFRSDNFGDLIRTDARIRKHLDWDYYSDNVVDPYYYIDLTANYKIERLFFAKSINLIFQIHNLTNNLYAAGAEGKEFFPAAERNFYFGIELSW
ncbi:MAG: TonB-dependent receptor [Candidatus Kapabacteria bacterium]|nr:TonB-dependent receptor [Candidatus Kapabacteria bacterium]